MFLQTFKTRQAFHTNSNYNILKFKLIKETYMRCNIYFFLINNKQSLTSDILYTTFELKLHVLKCTPGFINFFFTR